MTASPLRNRLLLVAAAILFSTGGAAIKAATLTGWQVACFRAGVAAVVLLAGLPRGRRGFNDIHYFAQHLGIPTLGYGPGGDDIHAVNERARVRDLVAAARIYADLLTSFDG